MSMIKLGIPKNRRGVLEGKTWKWPFIIRPGTGNAFVFGIFTNISQIKMACG